MLTKVLKVGTIYVCCFIFVSHIFQTSEKNSKVDYRMLGGIRHRIDNSLSRLLQLKICEYLTLKRLGAIMGAITTDLW